MGGGNMIYLDYSATTPVCKEVLDTFNKVSMNYIGNSNSLHKLGVSSKQLMREATNQIAKILGVKPTEIIYTSGATESNNLIIKGILDAYPKRGKQIITTKLEHSSILEPLHYLETKGYHVDYVSLNQDGTVNLEHLKELLSDETILVTIASVSSELGIQQPIREIGMLVHQYPRCFFHSDMTQSIGKVNVSFEDVDAASFSAHKFYGLKGIGVLVKKENVQLTPLFHGGESTTVYRSGTPALPLIVSLSKALRLSLESLDRHYKQVEALNSLLRKELENIMGITINSTSSSIPHILNFSVEGIKPETLLHALEEHEIYLSTKSACSSHAKESLSVMSVYHDASRASHSLRASLSYLTSDDDIKQFVSVLKDCIETLSIR